MCYVFVYMECENIQNMTVMLTFNVNVTALLMDMVRKEFP